MSAPSSASSPAAFADLPLSPELLRNLVSLGYTEMTPIQAQSLPLLLAGKDVIGQAKTGSGKTAAFGLGLLARLDRKAFRVQGLVLCPTRELADQVANALRDLARTIPNIKVLTLCGGAPFGPQAGSLEHGAHLVVGTPGRVDDHLRKGTLKLEAVTTLVLDEADRMLDMGFQEQLDAIVAATPAARQTLMFSATFSTDIKAVAKQHMRNPERVTVADTHDNVTIEQHFYEVADDDQRFNALRLALLQYQPESTVVFCNTKKETQELASSLRQHYISALAIHGDLEQNDRDRTLVRFANKSTSVLVATDVAARGLDIESLDAVVNYHLAGDTEVHVHRVGRTGRAGSTGKAFTLFTRSERYKVERLEEYLQVDIQAEALPPRELLEEEPPRPVMVTLQIDGGKKQKLRPGDILGALTAKGGIAGKQVGKINIFDQQAFVAIDINAVNSALKTLGQGKLKGRSFKARRVEGQPENSRRLARRR
ncbi:MAG: ATP-dependent RNA helicase DbpA [Gammaproteobacteria bacterium]